MSGATLIDGKAVAADLLEHVRYSAEELTRIHGFVPGLAVILVGEDAASRVYVASKVRRTAEVGLRSVRHELPSDTSEAQLLALIDHLNDDPAIDGILVQLPRPEHIRVPTVLERIHPSKDVDGFHVANVGALATGTPGLVPCTPRGCLILLRRHLPSLRGKRALVIGRSNIVGKPMAMLLLQEDCTVTLAHRWTDDLASEVRRADIVIAAVGKPGLIRGDWVKSGSTILDVGINRIEDGRGGTRLVGDVEFEAARQRAGAITPVPGGVGPMTIACLLANTVTAARWRRRLPQEMIF